MKKTVKYEVAVLNCETYTVYACNDKDAKVKAIDCFFDDDMFMGKDDNGNEPTIDDCEIVWREEL